MNNHSTNQNGSISFGNNSSSGGNATNNSSSSGLSSDADGVKGIAINAALDTFARVLKFISNQIASGLTFVLQHIVQAITWTSTPEMGDNFYHNPSNGIWEGMYSSYKQIWQPLALAAACLLTGSLRPQYEDRNPPRDRPAEGTLTSGNRVDRGLRYFMDPDGVDAESRGPT